jgi:polyisoprenoid-binding protein YceI
VKKFAHEFHRVSPLALIALAMLACAPGAANAAMMRFKVDVDQSTVSASVAEPAAAIRGNAVGTFRIIDGEVIGDPDNIAGTAKLRILIDATSYRSNSASRDRTVTEKSLESDKFPTIGFESNTVVGVVMTGASEGTAIVTGFLTLHGESHAMTFPVQARLAADGTLVGGGEVKFNYEEFGVKVPALLFGSILAGDEATIHFHIVAANIAAAAPSATPAAAGAIPGH